MGLKLGSQSNPYLNTRLEPSPGRHSIQLDVEDYPQGAYQVRLVAASATRRMCTNTEPTFVSARSDEYQRKHAGTVIYSPA